LGFNLSHTADQALVAVANTEIVGVDIEEQREVQDLEHMAASHFAKAELDEWRALPVDRQIEGFFAAWTRKEAYVKACGAGLSMPLPSFEVALHPDLAPALRTIGGSRVEALGWTLWSQRPTHSTWAAVAVGVRDARIRTFAFQHE
jgi:4'-phosphopantetheinyl transferase